MSVCLSVWYSGAYTLTDILESGGREARERVEKISQSLNFDQPINIQFTSVRPWIKYSIDSTTQSMSVSCIVWHMQGTTGNPKGATLTHHNLVNNAYLQGLRMGYDKEAWWHKSDRQLTLSSLMIQLYQCCLFVARSSRAACTSLPLLWHGPWLNADADVRSNLRISFFYLSAWGLSDQHRGGTVRLTLINLWFRWTDFEEKILWYFSCNVIYGTPTMFIDVLNHPNLHKYDVSSLNKGNFTISLPIP